jgi:hypothetical protein
MNNRLSPTESSKVTSPARAIAGENIIPTTAPTTNAIEYFTSVPHNPALKFRSGTVLDNA